LQAGREPELRIRLGPSGDRTDLVLQFRDCQSFGCAKGLSEFFDATQLVADLSGLGYSLNWRLAVPPSAFGLDEGMLQHERARLAQKTRAQLTDGGSWSLDEFFQYLSEICQSAEPLQALLDHVRQLCGRDELDDDFSVIEVSF
jgi:hypothetical protein